MEEEKKEIAEEITEEDIAIKKKKKRKRIIIIGIIILIIGALIFSLKDAILISKKDLSMNEKNRSYLITKYGDNIKPTFISKKKKKKYNIWNYDICSKTTTLCVRAKYNDKKNEWEISSGEGFLYTLLFFDEAVEILTKNNISYKPYKNNKGPFDLASKFILVIKKDNVDSLVTAVKEIDKSNLIEKLCSYNRDDNKCTGEMEIDIFNDKDYDAIINKKKNNYGISGYYDLYKVLLDKDDNKFDSRLGTNIVRHRIGDNMFACTNDDCSTYKHLTYRYVIGDHNQFQNSIIIEGL